MNLSLSLRITRLRTMRSSRSLSVHPEGTTHQIRQSVLMIKPDAEWSLLRISRLSHHHDGWDHPRRLFEAVCILVER